MQTVGKYFFYAPTFEGKSQDEKITRCGRSLNMIMPIIWQLSNHKGDICWRPTVH